MIFRNKIYFLYITISLFLINIVSAIQNTSIQVDVVNSSYMKDWLFFLTVSNKTGPWEFPILGFGTSIMGPFTDAFSGFGVGNIVYLILWGLFILVVWRQSGKITIPSMIACISAGAMSLLIPESSQPFATILLCAAIASQLLTFFAKE